MFRAVALYESKCGQIPFRALFGTVCLWDLSLVSFGTYPSPKLKSVGNNL